MAKSQPIDYYLYPIDLLYVFIGSEKDNKWLGVLNDVDNAIVRVVNKITGTSWSQLAQNSIIIPNKLVQFQCDNDQTTKWEFLSNLQTLSLLLVAFLVSTDGVISPGLGCVVSPISGPRPYAGVFIGRNILVTGSEGV